MIFGLEHLGRVYDLAVRDYVATSGVPMLVVDYRIAPEHPHPTPVEDCYAALRWLADNAATLGVDPARIAVMGDSAGGGLAAGVCLLARDRGGPPVAQQLLIYPMLDDRMHMPDPQLLPFLTWTYDDNVTGWAALLGDSAGTDTVSPYAAPARATDLAGPAGHLLDVGDLDIFRDEDITYAPGCRMRACRPSCTCIRDARTHSRRWRAGATFRSEQSAIASVACAPSSHRKTLTLPTTSVCNNISAEADIQLRSARCVVSDLGNV